jgi:hypothetical protein
MKITKKQQQEVDFLIKEWKLSPTEQQIKEYIGVTVLGKATDKSFEAQRDSEANPLLIAKRKLDIMVKMWTEDLEKGLISYQELREDFNCPYFDRTLKSIWKSNSKKPYDVHYLTSVTHGIKAISLTNRIYG